MFEKNGRMMLWIMSGTFKRLLANKNVYSPTASGFHLTHASRHVTSRHVTSRHVEMLSKVHNKLLTPQLPLSPYVINSP